MKFTSIEEIKSEGYVGFRSIPTLMSDCSSITKERGVYTVFFSQIPSPEFVVRGVGGFFKGKDPNVPLSVLESNWVNDSIVVYIGQAGGIRNNRWSNATLRKRIKQYMRFGQGQNVGHYGGRLIWQLKNYKHLMVSWKELPNKVLDPKVEELKLLNEFVSEFGKLPFANLQ